MEKSIIRLLTSDGSIKAAELTVEEIFEDGEDGVRVAVAVDSERVAQAFSERSVFSALTLLRLELEKSSVQLMCYASDERVYPSPMQEDMGFNTLAYKREMGCAAGDADIVNLIEYVDGLRCVSVACQIEYHRRWLDGF